MRTMPVPDTGHPIQVIRLEVADRAWSWKARWPAAVSVSVSFADVRGSPRAVVKDRHTGEMDPGERLWTVILRTEKRKVGGSTPPLTTHNL
jgi:hypothetical protein